MAIKGGLLIFWTLLVTNPGYADTPMKVPAKNPVNKKREFIIELNPRNEMKVEINERLVFKLEDELTEILKQLACGEPKVYYKNGEQIFHKRPVFLDAKGSKWTLVAQADCPHPFRMNVRVTLFEFTAYQILVDNQLVKKSDDGQFKFDFQGRKIALGSPMHLENRTVIDSAGLIDLRELMFQEVNSIRRARKSLNENKKTEIEKKVDTAIRYPIPPEQVLDLLSRLEVESLEWYRRVDEATPRAWYRGYSGSECFPAGVPIRTPIGDVPIERLAAGDTVLTYDFIDRAVKTAKIAATIKHQVSALVKIYVDDGIVVATPDHPFFSLTHQAFINAGELSTNDILWRLNDKRSLKAVPVVSVGESTGEFIVYNLSVPDYENYFASGFLVHNRFLAPQTHTIQSHTH